ncbi:TetR/AcrR family transcriptional regulator [Nocardia cyriacigeorgica]|uniref:TetR/AcrR family transcriptional regulator n=1 Tax=Nocardia cyriacigeorgica TaxID=135487 RepID=UPI002810E0C7|nr:TetR/AcrR family transcriptional regulator C-terminal ligand-binding domain-containing protein [Nocardia cyriacigeorgica]
MLDAIVEHGVDGVGIPDVSRRAGVRDSSIYRRWGSRENLLLEVLLEYSSRTMPLPDTGTLRGDLAVFAAGLMAYLDTPLGAGLTRALSYVTDTEEMAVARDAFWDSRYIAVQPLFERAVARGEIPPSVDVRFALELLIGPIHFRAALTRQPVDGGLADRVASHVAQALTADWGDELGGQQHGSDR